MELLILQHDIMDILYSNVLETTKFFSKDAWGDEHDAFVFINNFEEWSLQHCRSEMDTGEGIKGVLSPLMDVISRLFIV